MFGGQPTVGFVVSEMKQNIFLCTNSQFFGELRAAHVEDPLILYRDFPACPKVAYFQHECFKTLTKIFFTCPTGAKRRGMSHDSQK
jgi:hypothetical protein